MLVDPLVELSSAPARKPKSPPPNGFLAELKPLTSKILTASRVAVVRSDWHIQSWLMATFLANRHGMVRGRWRVQEPKLAQLRSHGGVLCRKPATIHCAAQLQLSTCCSTASYSRGAASHSQ